MEELGPYGQALPSRHAGGRGEVGGLVNLHYGQDPGAKFYTYLSDQFGPFHTKVIAATANESPHFGRSVPRHLTSPLPLNVL